MPVAIKAYACEFRCGRKVTTNKKAVLRHEEICFSNPAVKACWICKHFGKDYDDNGIDGVTYGFRYCELEKLIDGQFAKKDCEFHELRCG